MKNRANLYEFFRNTTDLDKQRHDVIWTNKIKKIARLELVLHEKFDEICYSEYTYPAKERLFHGMEFENYVDIYKKDMKQLTYDHLLHFLKKAKNGKDELKDMIAGIEVLPLSCSDENIFYFGNKSPDLENCISFSGYVRKESSSLVVQT